MELVLSAVSLDRLDRTIVSHEGDGELDNAVGLVTKGGGGSQKGSLRLRPLPSCSS